MGEKFQQNNFQVQNDLLTNLNETTTKFDIKKEPMLFENESVKVAGTLVFSEKENYTDIKREIDVEFEEKNSLDVAVNIKGQMKFEVCEENIKLLNTFQEAQRNYETGVIGGKCDTQNVDIKCKIEEESVFETVQSKQELFQRNGVTRVVKSEIKVESRDENVGQINQTNFGSNSFLGSPESNQGHSTVTKIYPCPKCLFRNQSVQKLFEHLKLNHEQTIENLCETEKPHLNKYTEAETSGNRLIFQCFQCGFNAKHRFTIIHHFRVNHDKNAQVFHCSECKYMTKRKSNLREHFKVMHDAATEVFRCSECPFQTKTKCHLNKHIKSRHVGMFRCSDCAYESKIEDNLKRHCHVKHGREALSFRCSECAFATRTQGNLNRHFKFKHAKGTAMLQCSQCLYKTKRKGSLKTHIAVLHNVHGEVFCCLECPYRTKLKMSLAKHFTLRHDKEAETLRCSECAYETKLKGKLNQHVKMKHSERSEIFRCGECSYSTRRKSSLKKHFKFRHDGNAPSYQCSKCAYHTKNKDSLKRHFRRMHGEARESLRCDFPGCSFTARTGDNLLLHFMFRHEGQAEVFQCSACTFKTKSRSSLRRHFRIRHDK